MKRPTSRSIVDLGRAFLFTRATTPIFRPKVSALGHGNMDPEKVPKLGAVEQIENLVKIGLSAGDKIKLEHFGPFAQQAAAI
jgi:hypothetical protein